MRTPTGAGPVRRALSHWAVRVALGLLVAAGLVLAALPYAAGYGIQRWLLAHGADRVALADVSLNPFTGRLGIKGLTVIVSGTRVLALQEGSVQLDWLPLTRRQVWLASLSLTGARAGFERRADGTWLGPIPSFAPAPEAPAPAAEGPPWGFGIGEAVLEQARVDTVDGAEHHTLHVDHLSLQNLASWAPDRPAHGSFAGGVDSGSLALEGDLTPFAAEPAFDGRLTVRALDLGTFGALAAGPVEQVAGQVRVDAEVSVRHGADGVHLSQDGTLTLEQAAVTAGGRKAQVERLAWEGKLHLVLPASGPPLWETDGRMEGGPAAVDLTAQDVRVADRHLVWRGRAAGSLLGGWPNVTGEGILEGVQADLPARGVRLLAMQEASFDGLMVDPSGRVDVDGTHLIGLVVGTPLPTPDADAGAEERPPLLTVAAVQADSAHRAPDGALAMAAVRVDGLDASVERMADGRLRLIGGRLARLAPAEGKAPDEAASPLPPFRVGDVTLTGDSRVRFSDRTVEPAFELTARLKQARVQDLDSHPEAAPARVSLDVHLGDYTDVALSGTVAPFAGAPTLALTGTVRRLDLPPFSVYTAGLLGYNVSAGQLDADLDVRADHGRLDGKSRLTLRKLEVAPGDRQRMARLSRELTMPLDAALDLLRDRNDTIKVDLPLAGDLEDPTVDLGGVISKALGNGLKKGALEYARIALQPFGALVTVVQLANKANALRLDPVSFTPGSSALDPGAADYAAKVAKLLKSRPRLTLRLCGQAAATETQALDAQSATQTSAAPEAPAAPPPAASEDPEARLKALAQARAEAFRDSLVSAYGVDPGRLILCLPEIDAGKDAAPRVDLLI